MLLPWVPEFLILLTPIFHSLTNEVLYDAEKVASRARSVVPFVTIAIITEAKHMASIDQPDLVNEKIIQFSS